MPDDRIAVLIAILIVGIPFKHFVARQPVKEAEQRANEMIHAGLLPGSLGRPGSRDAAAGSGAREIARATRMPTSSNSGALLLDLPGQGRIRIIGEAKHAKIQAIDSSAAGDPMLADELKALDMGVWAIDNWREPGAGVAP